MKNNFFKILLFFLLYLNLSTFSFSEEEFNFQVTEINIIENGDIVIGSNGGKAITNNGIEILGENFWYNKVTNILKVDGKVKLINNENNTTILSDKATYLKNKEIVFTEGNSKAVDKKHIITASNFKFDKINNILTADKNVKFIDKEKDTTILSDKATYLKNKEILKLIGKTSAVIENKYYFVSENVDYLKNKQELNSNKFSTVTDKNGNIYELDSFKYEIDKKLLKGKNVNAQLKIDEENIDNYFFAEGFFNLSKNSFVSKKTKINVHKNSEQNIWAHLWDDTKL